MSEIACRRLAQGHVQGELADVIVDHGVQVLQPRIGEQMEAVEQFDGQGPLDGSADASAVFDIAPPGRLHSTASDVDLGISSMDAGIGDSNLVTDTIEFAEEFQLGDVSLCAGDANPAQVADAQVLSGPEHNDVHILAGTKVAEVRPLEALEAARVGHQVAAAAEGTSAIAREDGWRQRQKIWRRSC